MTAGKLAVVLVAVTAFIAGSLAIGLALRRQSPTVPRAAPRSTTESAFLFCYSRDFANFRAMPPLLLLYSSTAERDEERFRNDCVRRGDLFSFFKRSSAFCWPTVSAMPRLKYQAWDVEWLEHRCYMTEELCNDQRRSMLSHWESEKTPVPLVGTCSTTYPDSEFLRFTTAIGKRKYAELQREEQENDARAR